MTRISTFCALSSTLAVIALSANGASAATITVHTTVPRVIVHVPQPKVIVHTPQLKILGNHGTVAGTKSGSNHGSLKDGSGEIANKKIDSSAIQNVGLPAIDASDKNQSTISTVNPVPPFSFNKTDPAAKASVVFVGPQKLNNVLENIGMSPQDATNLANGVRKGGAPGMALALGLATSIAVSGTPITTGPGGAVWQGPITLTGTSGVHRPVVIGGIYNGGQPGDGKSPLPNDPNNVTNPGPPPNKVRNDVKVIRIQ
jgi:hypothetical protein